MRPRDLLVKWIEAFNNADTNTLADLYGEHAINHQVANDPVEGRTAIKKMFEEEFTNTNMVCIVENIFEDNEWAILEWIDPKGLRGCVFFHIINDKIIFQRRYRDRLVKN